MADIFELFRKISKESTSATPISYIVVGLGNPGIRYQWTRHNAGFLAMDAITAKYGGNPERAKFNALVGETTIAGKRVLLMKPQTFMNASGDAVEAAMSFYKLTPAQLLVISDDISLDVGKLRVRKSGSAGGQKGLNSIIESLGTQEFARIRIGIRDEEVNIPIINYVLSEVRKEDYELFATACQKAGEAAAEFAKGLDIERVMCKYN